jgi:transcriptional regulator with XRE-family HTH domain
MIDLAALRRLARPGLTQTELAAELGVGQAQISKIERQSDMLLSTLSAYLTALGVDAKLVVEVGEQTETYDLTAGRQAP